MRNLQAQGLDGFPDEPLPELSPAAQIAVHCWSFCEGWAPQIWTTYDALYPVPDWHHLIDLLTAIRNAHRTHQQQAQANRP